MTTPSFTAAPRMLTSVLAPLERRTLLWIAPRLPRVIHSDHLTGLALAAMALAGASFAAARWHAPLMLLAIPALGLNWFGDSLDGTLARVRKEERPRYGFYVDHVLDGVGILMLVAGMAISGLMTAEVAMMFVIAYFLLVIEVYVATYCLGEFHMSFWRIGPTELRIIVAAGTIALFLQPTVTLFGDERLLLDVGGVVATIGLVATFAVSFARNTRRLYRLETLRERQH